MWIVGGSADGDDPAGDDAEWGGGPAGGGDRDVRLRAELVSVRRELERLVESRLQGGWSDSTSSRYRHLVSKERWLLDLDAS